MEMIIKNRLRLKVPPPALQKLLSDVLMVPNPRYLEAAAAGRYVHGIAQYITNFVVLADGSWVIPRGMRQWVVDKCKLLGIDLTITDERALFDPIVMNSLSIKYFSYQFDAVVELITKAPEGILVAPAGCGKTASETA